MRHLHTILLLLFCGGSLCSQAPLRQYKVLGTTGYEEARKIIKTFDGNFLVVGYINGTLTHGTGGLSDGLVMKLDANGNVIWAYAIGGSLNEGFYDVVYYKGDYYCVGYTDTWRKNVTPPGLMNKYDIFLVSLEDNGATATLNWAKHFGHPTSNQDDIGEAIVETTMSGVILVGDFNPTASIADFVALRVLPDGTMGFAKRYSSELGGSTSSTQDLARDICRDAEGNYVISLGSTGAGSNNRDGLAFKIDVSGNVLWSNRYYIDDKHDGGASILLNPRNNLLYTAAIYAKDIASNFKYIPAVFTFRQSDGLHGTMGGVPQAVVYDTSLVWQRGSIHNRYGIKNGFYLTTYGATNNNNTLNSFDANILALDDSLGVDWQVSFGGPRYDYVSSISSCNDHADIVGVGATRSFNPVNSANNFDILWSRITQDGHFTQPTCEYAPDFTPQEDTTTILADQDTTYNLTGYATDDLIDSFPAIINITSDIYLIDSCGVTEEDRKRGGDYSPIFSEQENFVETVKPEMCPFQGQGCQYDIRFGFTAPVLSATFVLMDELGVEVYRNDDRQKLSAGIKYADIGLLPALYHWRIQVPLPNGLVESHYGEVNIR